MLARAEKAAQPVWDVFRVRIKTRSARAIDRAPSSAHREPHSLPTEGEMSKYETERGSSGLNNPFLVQMHWNDDFSETNRNSHSRFGPLSITPVMGRAPRSTVKEMANQKSIKYRSYKTHKPKKPHD